MVEISDYTNALNQFLSGASQLRDKLLSIILYGSMVKGSTQPGVSDILDAAVILHDSVLTTESEYYEALDVLTDSCARIRDIGIPFHPVHYFILDDAGWSATWHFLPAWKSDRYSQIVTGVDVRALLHTCDTDFEFMRGWYVQLYWSLQHAALSLKRGLRSPERPKQGVGDLLRILRDIPQFACLACGVPVDRDQATAEIARLFPDADIGLLPQLCDRFAAYTHDKDEVVLTDQILEVNDELYRVVSQRMFNDASAGDVDLVNRRGDS